MADPDFVPPLHKRKGDLLYDVDENRRRRGVKYQLLKLKQKSDSSGSTITIDAEGIWALLVGGDLNPCPDGWFGAIFWEEFAVGAEKILIIIGSSAEKL